SSQPVMNTTGRENPAPRSIPRRLRPSPSGRRTSATRQPCASRAARSRNSRPEAKASTRRPAERSRRVSELRTSLSSSTTKTTGPDSLTSMACSFILDAEREPGGREIKPELRRCTRCASREGARREPASAGPLGRRTAPVEERPENRIHPLGPLAERRVTGPGDDKELRARDRAEDR